ncbi:Uncharacterised protein [uncultured archaeon]|nr:Uncharacterised protein [uncultured archaeon]
MLNIFKKDYFLILILYTFAHGLILLNGGIYWDDWVLYNVDKAITIDRFWQNGAIWVGYFHGFLLSFENGIFLYRLSVFLAFFLSALFLNSILKNIREIDSTSRFFIVLFFALFPVNSARIALITVPYALSYFLFFLGFWVVSKYSISKNIFLRFLSLPILFSSFFIKSLLIFYCLVILYIIYNEKVYINSLASLMKGALKYIDFLLLPVVFWIIQSIYFVPYGFYQGYNKLSLQDLWLPLTYKSLSDSFNLSFIEVLKASLHSLSPFILIIFVAILALVISKQKINYQEQNNKDIWLFAMGVLSFFIAVYPYIVTNHLPSLYDWNSRNQLLVPLGSSFILYYGIKIISNKLRVNVNVRILIYSVLILLFINANINNYIEYEKDWYKQLSLIENLKANDDIRDNTTFLFKDNTLDFNAKDRTYRFYEYTGLLKYSFNDEKRFGENLNDFKKMDAYKPYLNAYYNMNDYKLRDPEFQVVINHGEYNLTNIDDFFKLEYLELFEHETFESKVGQLISLEVVRFKDHYES